MKIVIFLLTLPITFEFLKVKAHTVFCTSLFLFLICSINFFAGQKRANEIYKEALKRAQDEPAATPIVTGPVA